MSKTIKIKPMYAIPSYTGLKKDEQDVKVANDWDFNVLGICVGKMYENGEKLSYISKDNENGNTEIFDKLLEEYKLEKKSVTLFIDNELIGLDLYCIMYNVLDHYTGKPTVTDTFVESAINVEYEVTYELLFVAGEGYKKYMTVNYKTGGSGSMPFYSHLEGLEDLLEELTETEDTGFTMEDGYMSVDFYDNLGSKETLEIGSLDEFMSMLASARVIEIKQKIK